ncbi:MAG TPA: 16S rRNA (cytidine(1402)-2'-O)-methyltransferase [Spirochaetia bacterium]|nr:16S rRNA (cytidine(1402)-2'-O)-methyltransferase [Spirochaetia bacterium]
MGKLYIIATPIGNLEDITLRALRILGEIDALACEDTRRTRILFAKHGIRSPRTVLSYRENNEQHSVSRILGLLAEGLSVGVCSDAGYPGISDAGFRVIQHALAKGHTVEVLPGAGAIEPALLSSGLPTSSFTFKGFPPRKPGARRKFLEMEKDLPHTLVFYESPFRLHTLLTDAREVLGDRLAAVSIELTKQFERTVRGSLSELCGKFKDWNARGEVTVVVAGNKAKFTGDDDGKALGEDL